MSLCPETCHPTETPRDYPEDSVTVAEKRPRPAMSPGAPCCPRSREPGSCSCPELGSDKPLCAQAWLCLRHSRNLSRQPLPVILGIR